MRRSGIILPLAVLATYAACSDGGKDPLAPAPVVPAAPLATHFESDGPDVSPILSTVTRNQTCSDLIGSSVPSYAVLKELKVDEGAVSGDPSTHSDGTLSVEIHHWNGKSYDFLANRGVWAVYNKAGAEGSYLYWYTQSGGPGPQTADDQLTTPGETGNNISHVSFCYALVPDFEITKTGDELSKIGDDVTYTFTIENTGDFDLDLSSISDDKLGDLASQANTAGCDVLSVGETCSFSVTHTVPAGASDPYDNVVTAIYDATVNSTTQSLTRTDDHSLNLFQPSITFDKTGPAYSKAGDVASYTLTLGNTSSSDTPDLVCTITDALLGVEETVTLASGTSRTINASRTTLSTDPDPLVNTAEASCSPTGFPNVLTASDSWTTDLLHPSFTVTKVCLNDPVPQGSDAEYRITLSNTGDADLVFDVSDPAASYSEVISIAAGETVTRDVSVPVPSGASTVDNTVSGTVTLAAVYGLSNSYTFSETATCNVQQELEGCTPGFWQGGTGSELWNTVNDPDWTAAGGAGSNPYIHTTSFNSFFGGTDLPGNPTMMELVSSGGGESNQQKAARSLVAAFLNSSFGMSYPYTTTELHSMWNAADTDAEFLELHNLLDAANNEGCPID